MKTLVFLSALQTIGIVILLIHVLDDRGEPAATARAANPVAVTTAAPRADEERLRVIIREELAAQRAVQSHSPAPPPPAAARDEASNRQLQERVSQQIEAYQAAGSISEAQMQELQAQIVQLDDAGRRKMMSKLIRAMNAADIKGRL